MLQIQELFFLREFIVIADPRSAPQLETAKCHFLKSHLSLRR